jgi:CrcB protein
MLKIFLIGFGGFIGTIARYGLNGVISARVVTFPLGTLIVNVTGCFAIGFIGTLSGPAMGRAWFRPETRDFWLIGFCGGYTTFSSYGWQTLTLARDAEWGYALANIVGSNVAGLVAVYLGRVAALWLQTKISGGMP